MKLQISFDQTDLNQALEIATQTAQFADILEVGTPLIYKEGVKAIQAFKSKFSDKQIFADTKMVDRVEDVIPLFKSAGADYVSILAGTSNNLIQKASGITHSLKLHLALDLIDAYSMGQSAMDAKTLDVDLIIFHRPHDTKTLTEILEEWQNVQGNTELPIFIEGGIDKKMLEQLSTLKPKGLIIGAAITNAQNPAQEAEYFKSILGK